MKKIIALCLLTVALPFAQEQNVIVMPCSNVDGALSKRELDRLPERINEEARKALPGEFALVKPELAAKMTATALAEACSDEGCARTVVEGNNLDYGVQCDVFRDGKNFELKIQLYSQKAESVVAQFTKRGLKDSEAMLALLSERLPGAFKAMLPKKPPGKPLNLAARPGNRHVELSWKAPPDGGSPIMRYEVSNGSALATVSDTTAYDFAGLENGKSYAFKVRAVNAAGGGEEASADATPSAKPSEPLNFAATPGDRTVRLSWTAPDDGGSRITMYRVSKDDGLNWVNIDKTEHVFASLENGTEYKFKVRAVNANGEGAAAGIAETPNTKPSAPLNFRAAPGDGRVEVSWEAPLSDGGSRITGYEVSRDTVWMPASGSKGHVFEGLANGKSYTFKFRAVNANGNGAEASVTAVPKKPPPENIPSGIDQPGKSGIPFWAALALDAAGAGFVAYGVKQHFRADKAYDEYKSKKSGSAASFESAWKRVDDLKSSRNLFYMLGGVSLGLGIGVHVAF
jgi:hypothetical protein